MKTHTTPRVLTGITTLLLTATLAWSPSPAAIIVRGYQQGNDYLIESRGSLDFSQVTSAGQPTNSIGEITLIDAPIARFISSNLPPGGATFDTYTVTGPSNFGTGSGTFGEYSPSSTGGLELFSSDELYVLDNFLNGGSATNLAIFANQTQSSLGITTGTYDYFYDGTSELALRLIFGDTPATPTSPALTAVPIAEIPQAILVTNASAILSADVLGPAIQTSTSASGMATSRTALNTVFSRNQFIHGSANNQAPGNTVAINLNHKQASDTAKDKQGQIAHIPASTQAAQPTRWSLYSTADYGRTDQRDIFADNDYTTTSWGATAGIEYAASPHFTFGLATSLYDTDAEVRNLADIDTDTVVVLPYLRYQNNNYYASAIYAWGYHDHDLNRNGLDASNLRGDTSTHTHTLDLNSGYNLHHGPYTHGPTAGISYTFARTAGYSETGPSLSALDYQAQDNHELNARAGWQVSREFDTSWGRFLSQLRLGYEYQYSNYGASSTSLQNSPFSLVSGTNITPFGAGYSGGSGETNDSSHFFTYGFTTSWSPFSDETWQNLSLYANYQGRLSPNHTQHTANLGLNFNF